MPFHRNNALKKWPIFIVYACKQKESNDLTLGIF
jgi:hypothetical protein